MKFTKFSFEFLKENMSLADFERILLRINPYSNYKNYIESSCSCMKCVKSVQKAVSCDAIQNKRNIISKNCQRMTQTVYKINMKLMKNQINVII